MNKRHYEHTLPNIRGSLSNTYDENKKELLYKELDILTTEEEVANGLLQFEVSEKVRLSIMDKIENYYAPKLKAYYTAL